MALYFLLGTLNEDGQRLLHEDPEQVADAVRSCRFDDATILGQYAVIGRPDFILMAEADDNEAITRLSLELGVHVGLHIETLPAVAISVLAHDGPGDKEGDVAQADGPPTDLTLPDLGTLQSVTDIFGTGRNR